MGFWRGLLLESDHIKNRDGEGKTVTLEVSNPRPLSTQIYIRCDLPKFSGRNSIKICKYFTHKDRRTFLH